MGIFTVPTDSVRNTRIYVSPSPSQPRQQLTIYKTEVNTRFEAGWLILPVPYPETVRLHRPAQPYPPSTNPYLDFLNRVESAFDDRERHRARHVEPVRVSSYERMDIIHSMEDLQEFNEREDILPEPVMEQLAEIYHEPYWGFLLCAIRQGSHLYEPICYTHRTIAENLYIPSLIYQPTSFRDVHIPEESDRFDDRYFMNGCHYSESMGYRFTEVDVSRVHTIPWNTLPQPHQQYLPYFLSEFKRGLQFNSDSLYLINPSLQRDSHPHHRRYSDELYPAAW